MKHLATVLCGLLTMNSIFAMDKKIIIYNKNVGDIGDYKGLNINLKYFDSEGRDRGEDINGHPVGCQDRRVISLNSEEEDYKAEASLCMYAAVPRNVKLLITQDGPLKGGDKIIVSESQTGISVSNQTGTAALVLAKASQLLHIGSNPGTLVAQTQIPQQTLLVRNKNLVQVMIYHAIQRNGNHRYLLFSPYARTRDAEQELRRTDILSEQITLYLRQGEEKMLTTFPSNDNVDMVTTLTKLLIPQALQDVQVHINDGKIKSGDTLEISYSKEDNYTISIVNQHGQILATLCTVDSVITLG